MREVKHGEIWPFARQDLVSSKSPQNFPSPSYNMLSVLAVLRPAGELLPKTLLEMQILSPPLEPTELEMVGLGVAVSNLCFKNPSKWFCCTLQFKTTALTECTCFEMQFQDKRLIPFQVKTASSKTYL